MGLVDHVHLEATGHRGVEGSLAKISRVVHATMAGRVDLDDVDRARSVGSERDAGVALATRLRGGALLTVQRTGEDPRGGRLAAAARPGEEVRVVQPTGAQRLRQRLGHVLLADDLGERARPIFPVERECHLRPPSASPSDRAGTTLPPRCDNPETQGPPVHPSELTYPCCLPALGRFMRCTPHEGLPREYPVREGGHRWVSWRTEDSPRGLGRTLGKRVGFTPSRVRISYPPPAWPGKTPLKIRP